MERKSNFPKSQFEQTNGCLGSRGKGSRKGFKKGWHPSAASLGTQGLGSYSRDNTSGLFPLLLTGLLCTH